MANANSAAIRGAIVRPTTCAHLALMVHEPSFYCVPICLIDCCDSSPPTRSSIRVTVLDQDATSSLCKRRKILYVSHSDVIRVATVDES